jgi:carboxypeptidase D
VQKELGSPVNFSANSLLAENIVLASSGDPIRREGMKDLEYLLGCGVKVALIYGDRDQRCPWLGAEQLSLAAKWPGADSFNAAGYEFVQTNDSYNGGIVRQHGNLSFSRVFEAGHDRTFSLEILGL